MLFQQHLALASIELNFDPSPWYAPPNTNWTTQQLRDNIHEGLLARISELLDASGQVANSYNLLAALTENTRRVSACIGEGFAIPHVRTMQVRNLTFALLRCKQGIDLDAYDGQLVQIFLGMVAPPYNDRLYLQVYRRLAEVILDVHIKFKPRLLAAESTEEMIQILDECYQQSNQDNKSIHEADEEMHASVRSNIQITEK